MLIEMSGPFQSISAKVFRKEVLPQVFKTGRVRHPVGEDMVEFKLTNPNKLGKKPGPLRKFLETLKFQLRKFFKPTTNSLIERYGSYSNLRREGDAILAESDEGIGMYRLIRKDKNAYTLEFYEMPAGLKAGDKVLKSTVNIPMGELPSDFMGFILREGDLPIVAE